MPRPIPDRPRDEAWEALLLKQLPRGLEQAPDRLAGQPWATPAKLASRAREGEPPPWLYQPGGIFLGFRDGKAIGRIDDKHVLVVAGSRSGKGVSVIWPCACTYPGSLVVIDPKAEVARLTARTRDRELGQRVHLLDPFKRAEGCGYERGGFNPLAELVPEGLTGDAADDAAIDNATLIADSLIVPNERDPHWTDAARLLLKGLILYATTLDDPRERNLVTVRRLLMLQHPDALPRPGDDAGEDGKPLPLDMHLLGSLASCAEFDGTLASIARVFRAMPDKERSTVRSTAIAQTEFLDSPALRDCLRESTFRLADLKRERHTLYLCLPANRMGTHARWLRVIIDLLLGALEETRGKPDPPVLLCLDEFNVLGKMKRIANAAGQMAGYGCKLMIVLQDINQLKENYKETWETFVGNSGLFITFGNSDVSTLKYISDKLGTHTVLAESASSPGYAAQLGGQTGESFAPKTVPLLAPHEVERIFARERNRMLVTYAGMQPIIVQRCISYDDPFFAPLLG